MHICHHDKSYTQNPSAQVFRFSLKTEVSFHINVHRKQTTHIYRVILQQGKDLYLNYVLKLVASKIIYCPISLRVKRNHFIVILFHSIVAMEAISETSTYLHFSHHFKQDMTNEYAQIMEVRNTCSNYVF